MPDDKFFKGSCLPSHAAPRAALRLAATSSLIADPRRGSQRRVRASALKRPLTAARRSGAIWAPGAGAAALGGCRTSMGEPQAGEMAALVDDRGCSS